MSSIYIELNKILSNMTKVKGCIQSVYNLRTQISVVSANISHGDSSLSYVKESLDIVSGRIEKVEQKLKVFLEKSMEIEKIYKNTEKELVETAPKAGNIVWNQYKNDYKENIVVDFRNAAIEGSGNFVVNSAGYFSTVTATGRSAGENAFIMVNPTYASTTRNIASVGSNIVTGAKYGLPVVGMVIDFISLKQGGENTVDSVIKSTAHLGIGIAGGAAGSAIGKGIGKIIGGPYVGEGVGGVIGFCMGTAISTVGNMAFDKYYDTHLKSHVDKLTEEAKKSLNEGYKSKALAGGQKNI